MSRHETPPIHDPFRNIAGVVRGNVRFVGRGSYRQIDVAVIPIAKCVLLSHRGGVYYKAEYTGDRLQVFSHKGESMRVVAAILDDAPDPPAGSDLADYYRRPSWPKLHFVVLKFWWIAVLFAACPVFLVIQRRHKASGQSTRPGCANCGYDLRATPERCPECGKSREDAMARS